MSFDTMMQINWISMQQKRIMNEVVGLIRILNRRHKNKKGVRSEIKALNSLQKLYRKNSKRLDKLHRQFTEEQRAEIEAMSKDSGFLSLIMGMKKPDILEAEELTDE